MSVELTPSNQLGFPRPLTEMVKRSLTIHNPHPHPVAFKVKTTAPKQYCVRPNSGRVESGESVEVSILLQAMQVEPPPHAKCKDKFLVQSAFITPDEEMRTLGEMWAETELNHKQDIVEQKIKCVYLPPEDGAPVGNGIPEEGDEHLEQSRIDESPMSGRSSPESPASHLARLRKSARAGEEGLSQWTLPRGVYRPPNPAIFAAAPTSPVHTNGTGLSPASPATPTTAIPVTAKEPPPSASSVPEPSITATKQRSLPSLSADAIASAGNPTNVSLEQSLAAKSSDSEKLSLALKEIDRLRSELDEARGPQATGLRKRGTAAAAGVETAVEKAKEAVQSGQGVPVEVVAALVVAVFVMTYMFF